MEVTLNQLLEGKATKIKNKDYAPTRSYVEPFLERMSKITNDFRVQVKLPDQVTCTSGEGERHDDITYNRVLIQAVLPNKFDNHQEVIGMVYGLDVRKPLIKIYRGAINCACTNLCIFDPSFLNVQFIEQGKGISYKPVEYLMERESEMQLMLETLHNTEWNGSVQNIESNLGRWIRSALFFYFENGYGKIKLGTDIVIKAYSSMFVDQESPYYIGEGNNVDMFTVYNAFTELISNDNGKDIMNKCEKTILLRQILNF